MEKFMSLLQLRPKRQVTLPSEMVRQLHMEIGDYLEAQVEGNRLVLTVKEVCDKANPVRFTDLIGKGRGVYGSSADIDRDLAESRKERVR